MKWSHEIGDDEPDLTPMIDIVFLLIVFFMTVANIVTTQTVAIEVPIAEASKAPETLENRDMISLLPDGTVFYGPMPIAIDELGSHISGQLKQRPGLSILLRVDASTPYLHTQEVMQICSSLGILDIIFTSYQSDS